MCQSSIKKRKSLDKVLFSCSLQSFREYRSNYLSSVLTLTLENLQCSIKAHGQGNSRIFQRSAGLTKGTNIRGLKN